MLKQKSLQQIAQDFVDNRTDKSFNTLYNRLKPGLRKFIYKYHQDYDVVDEILAITLSKAYVYVDKYDSQWNFSTWIYKICQNECLMEIRRQNSLTSLNSMIESKMKIKAINEQDWKEETEYEFFEDEETLQPDVLYFQVLSEICNLPEHYREIISDRVVNKMKYKDIAEKHNLKINTVRSRIHSAKKVLKNMWIDKKIKSGADKNINIVGITVLELLDELKTKDDGQGSIHILSAKYGSDMVCLDVTEEAKYMINKHGKIISSNKLGGDPCHGIKKKLFIEYIENGSIKRTEIQEGKSFDLRT
jgi:RNA polymerase sigma factor (sigma-70 family)